jgi:hypothetical protein
LQLAISHKCPQDWMVIDGRRAELGLYFVTCMCRVSDVRASCRVACACGVWFMFETGARGWYVSLTRRHISQVHQVPPGTARYCKLETAAVAGDNDAAVPTAAVRSHRHIG